MDKNEIQKRVKEEEDYIRCPKCNNSLTKFLAKNSDGIEDGTIARLLMIPEEKVQEIYDEAVEKIKEEMKDE